MKTLLVPFHHAEPLPQLASASPADDAVIVSKGPAGPMLVRLYDAVAARVAVATEPLVVLSGDCTTALATVAGLQRRGLEPGVIWLDAHADFHTPRTTRDGDLSRMALAMLVGRAGYALTEPIGLRTVPEDACVVVAARSVDVIEGEALDVSAVREIALDALDELPLPTPPWYVHLDVDLIDPAELAPLRFPVAGGPSLDMVAAALRTLARRGSIAALGIACTFTAAALKERETLAPLADLIDAAVPVR